MNIKANIERLILITIYSVPKVIHSTPAFTCGKWERVEKFAMAMDVHLVFEKSKISMKIKIVNYFTTKKISPETYQRASSPTSAPKDTRLII